MESALYLAQKELSNILSPEEISADEGMREEFSGDKWFARSLPDLVLFPESTESVVKMVKIAARHQLPITPRGSGYGYVGGCVPSHGGIALSMSRMNRVLEIHRGDFVAVVQPGVITQQLQLLVEAQGLFYPPDPASRADCSLGGNIATNAGGPRCLKYGVTRDYVLGLEVVLADGSVVRLGSRTHKNKTGFDLGRLFVGSEGMLGIITEATLKLLPLPPYRSCLGIGFASTENALRCIDLTFRSGLLPCALEIADAFTLAAARKRTGSLQLEGCQAMIFIELDGQEASVRLETENLRKILEDSNPLFVNQALGHQQVEQLWGLRREFSFSLRDTGLTKLNEDVVVPRSRVGDLFEFAAQLQEKHTLPVACFGHAGDGNIHVNVMVDLETPGAREKSEEALDELFTKILEWKGVITGEHGIGLAKKKWWPLATSPEVRDLHQKIKTALDPHLLLNPGKFLS